MNKSGRKFSDGRPRIPVEKQREIKKLFAEGKSGYEIARLLGIGKSSVYRYRDYEPPSEPVEAFLGSESSNTSKQKKKPLEVDYEAYTMSGVDLSHIENELETETKKKGFFREKIKGFLSRF